MEPLRHKGPGACFSKDPVTTGPDNLLGRLTGNFTGPRIPFLKAPFNRQSPHSIVVVATVMLFEEHCEVIVVSKENIRERSSFYIAILFEIEDQLSFVARFED